jgi:hypothetical protein
MFNQIKRFLGKAYRTAKIFTKPTKNVFKFLSDTAKEVSSQYPPDVKNIISRHGSHKIVNIKLCREVVSKNIELLLKAIAGPNTWEEAKRKNGFDKFYHLFMIVTMENGSKLHVEKNEIMRISENPRACPNALDLGPPQREMTVSDLLNATRQRMGDTNFFTYDPFQNNCQSFVENLLKSMYLWSNESKDFVFQDIRGLRAELPKYTNTLAKGLTDVGAVLNTAYQKTKDYIEYGSKGQEGLDNQTDAS